MELSPLHKGKGSVLECGNFRGIKLMAHTIKLWERIIDLRIRQIVELDYIPFGFRNDRSTIEPLFALRILQEKYGEKGKDLHYDICGFGKGVRQDTKGLDLVVVEKERNTGAVCRHTTGHLSIIKFKKST